VHTGGGKAELFMLRIVQSESAPEDGGPFGRGGQWVVLGFFFPQTHVDAYLQRKLACCK